MSKLRLNPRRAPCPWLRANAWQEVRRLIITALNQRLDALVDLESAQTQQARETAQADYQSDLSAKRQQLEAMIADDLADTKEAEDAACKLAAAISRRSTALVKWRD